MTTVAISLLMCLVLVTSALEPIPPSSHAASCDRERKILSEPQGVVSSGNKEYPMDSHCEWLIRAPDKQSFITLTFSKMDTECSYDHVFIYDGDSYSSPLLGSFSGNTTPPSITTSQESMLILLYSDTNYVRSGFEASYVVAPCPLNCSHHGICLDHQCVCDPLYDGPGCERSLCPDDCSILDSTGHCELGNGTAHCVCKPGYAGRDCSLPDSNKAGGGTWHLVSTGAIDARAGHSGTYVPLTDSLYVFGGFAFRHVLGDTLVFSFKDNTWITVQTPTGSAPSPRHGHAAVCYHDNIILFGGEKGDGGLSNELWFFNVSSLSWDLMVPKSNFRPPPVTKHSVTLVDFYWLYVIGGSLSDGTFSSKMYRINVRELSGWEEVYAYGAAESSRRLVGHSAVYHSQTKTIFVFGGVTAVYSHLSKLSNQIHAFHVEKRYWIRVKYEPSPYTPLERAFHTAAIVGDYMVVYGGYTHKHVEEEICYDNETHLYHLRCHKWIDMSSLRKDFIGSTNPISQGVFSHSMGVRRSHTLVIFGGYSGHMRSHLLAYVLPSAVLSDQLLLNTCSRHKSVESCVSNLACGWCTDTNSCVTRKNSKNCNSFVSETCPGFCSALSDCLSCLIWGQSGSLENIISDRQDPFPPVACTWCVQDSKCHSGDDTSSICSSSINGSAGGSAGGWWGPVPTDIQALEECYTKDFPPGLVSIKYRHPINYSQPDNVSYLHQASDEILFRSEVQSSNVMEENIVKFLGFLHPLDAKPLSQRIAQLKLQICSMGSTAVLKLSNDSTSKNFEVVASHNPRPSLFCSKVRRPLGAPLFPDTSEGRKYMFDFIVKVPSYLNDSSAVQLTWNAFSVDSEVIDAKHLELYKNGSCSDHSNCLSCLTDTLCGWCESTSTCYPKTGGYPQVLCQKNGRDSFLVTHPDNCSVCSDYIYCEKCALVPTCEWLVESAICVRRGRFSLSVHSPESCPTPCLQRTSCVSCLGDPGLCAWCEETRTCFLFSTYTSSYAFGKCRDWVDENRSAIGTDLCRNCSRHSQCSSCVRDLTCGWCSSSDHRAEGVCTDGSCRNHLRNASSQVSLWSYSSCPDLEECLWNLHDCHENATCHNTPNSYTCECNVGFEGDGRNCIRACSEKCVHGYCSNSPLYKCVCDLGWTGSDCSVNCGCNNHSTCNTAIGVCDSCQDWTMGPFCELCKPGSYGNATTLAGCKRCDCNNHGSKELGVCDSATGTCYCMNNTVPPNCAKCEEGYYGDPSIDVCFEECHPRKVITNAVRGRFGSPSMSSKAQDCLWLLTVHSALDMQSLLGPMQSTGSLLQLTIHRDLHLPCPHNHVYVYDGLPNFVASGHPNVLLGAFCGTDMHFPLVATASSGYLTVHFKRDDLRHGFNATYERLEGDVATVTSGILWNVVKCRGNCSAASGQGMCDELYNECLCEPGFGGDDCSVKLLPRHLSWSTLYSSNSAANLSSPLDERLPFSQIGHSLLTVKGNLMLFGGYSPMAGDLNDLFQYHVASNRWNKIMTEYSPSPRHFHAAAVTANDSMYVYGGLRELKPEHWGVLGDFWELTPEQLWVQLPEITVSSRVISMAGSTLTAISDTQLVLVGGYSPSYGFFEKVMEYDTENKQWTQINCSGAQPIGLYGHTSVYHAGTESIYVFGGMAYVPDRVSPSNYLYSFHFPSRKWSRLPSDRKVNKPQTRPLPRYFHTSVVTENFMFVIGGRGTSTHLHSSLPFAYVFSCNLWIPLLDEAVEVVGSPPMPFVGASATASGTDLYFFGGMDGKLFKLSTPADMCGLFSVNRIGCIQQTGCAYCSLTEKGMNQTFCFSQTNFSQSKCYNPRESVKYQKAVNCNAEWIEKRDCQQYTTCTDCVATWPAFKGSKQVCQWCSNCGSGKCVPVNTTCDNENLSCNISRLIVTEPSFCDARTCLASDCEKCVALNICMWTSQVNSSTGNLLSLNMQQKKQTWSCVQKQKVISVNISSSPPEKCPAGCSENTDCTSCLESKGGEGGWHQCVWSEALKTCMSPTAELLRCEDGGCGSVAYGNASCPVPCWHHVQAAHCLAHANCGWCSFTGVDGRGLCMDGGILGPTGGSCKENHVLLNGVVMPSQTVKWLHKSTGPPVWRYLSKPPENECLNGHDTCDRTHEECVDTLEGFECHCKPGYKMETGKRCTPTCNQGCLNGTCIQPDKCQCNFGFVGANCSIMCKCNGHSNCPGPDKLDKCEQCMNNTIGSQCQKCKPLFVGNPINGGGCISCHDYCHTHSNVCLGLDVANITYGQSFNLSYLSDLIERQVEGPTDEAVCVDCKNNTEGNRCNQCINGFFKAGERLEDGCRPCECNGHGDTCNPLNGENCNCQNNTENDRQCAQKNMKNMLHMTPCWQLQCSKCAEYFLGSPSRGHQCYRQLYLDKEYCLDPTTQGECNRNPIPLVRGQTVFFAVQPRYMNVDIRVFVDISRGGVDFFLSSREDTFIVETERDTGLHKIYIDERSALPKEGNATSSSPQLQPKIGDARGLTTYIDLKTWEHFVLVRNLKNRLVVTIPQGVHLLRSARFFMVLRGTEEQTFGTLFFRQDQTRIDLFVFFSVFFSCFFLFLAVCVVGWKVKQAFDERHRRRLHAAEMKHMASRPFARVLALIEPSPPPHHDDPPPVCLVMPSPRKKLKEPAVRALAVEPLADGYAAVATILVQLPGGPLVRMALASGLVTSRQYYGYAGLRAAMRRRTSHANV